jgi:hypothetical protein
LGYLAAVTDPGSPDYVPAEERIAVFDNDGTLWCEKPMYIQFDYLLRKMALQVEEDPSLLKRQPWQAAWEKDFGWLGGAITKHYQGDDSDFRVLLGGILSLSEDQPVEQIEAEARRFIENERHPELDVPYRECVYRPMIELLRDSQSIYQYLVDCIHQLLTDRITNRLAQLQFGRNAEIITKERNP